MSYAIYTQFNAGIGNTKSHTLVIIDEYDENGNYTGKILAKAYDDIDHGKSMWYVTQVLASALNAYDDLISRLKMWFDEVSYKKANSNEQN
jgi:hypothetical protein|nr:MAG TPA: corrinoid adenosyltransferase [Caudoviricetes sp.]